MDTSLTAFRNALNDRYDFDRLAGQGGMADVYLATDRKHGRPVAVKILRARAGGNVDSVRFAREIETAARLQHPNILPVYDSGEAAGCLFFVMPYVEGGSLRARLNERGTLPWPEALAIVREVGDALQFAHSRGVVHRDIKPENILFLADHAVVADFGIAKAIAQHDGERITLAGHGLGTPEYMSPEQAFGESGIDARSDVYSLACVLHEMLSGQPPWTGDQPFELLMRKTTESPPLLMGSERSGTPPAVAGILQRALEREVHARFADVRAMMQALAAASGEAIDGNLSETTATVATPSVAVLPFANLGGDANDEYLCDGLSEELIQALAQVEGIRVVARTSSFRFKGYTGDVRTVGNDLSVAFLLEGSVRRSRNRLRIGVRLIDVKTGFERWSERFDREFADVFDVQDEIARAIVISLEGTLQPRVGALVQVATGDMTAYDAFLEARFHWNQRSPAALHRTVSCLERALSRDPTFAQAHSALAEAFVTLAMYGEGVPATLMNQARASALRALELAPGLSAARTALACVQALFDWNWIEAEQQFLVAMRAPQASATAYQWFAANVLVPQGRFPEAQAQLAHARAIDPLSAAVTLSIGVTYQAALHHHAAIREFQSVLVRDSQFGMAYYFLARSQSALGQHADALRTIERAEALLGASVECVGARGVILAAAGRVTDAMAVITRLRELASERHVSPVISAEVLAAVGDRSAAIRELTKAVIMHSTDLAWIGARPAFQALEGDGRFQEVVRAVGIYFK